MLFEFLTTLTNQELLSILCITNQEDCCEVTMSLKITTPLRPDLICSGTGKTYKEAKNALKHIKHFF